MHVVTGRVCPITGAWRMSIGPGSGTIRGCEQGSEHDEIRVQCGTGFQPVPDVRERMAFFVRARATLVENPCHDIRPRGAGARRITQETVARKAVAIGGSGNSPAGRLGNNATWRYCRFALLFLVVGQSIAA